MSASHVDDILDLHDAAFIREAYQALLHRSPDHQGGRYYLRRLRNGVPKIHILMQLRASPEGRFQREIPAGLDMAIKRYKKTKWPLIGRLFSPKINSVEYQLRALQNQIFQLQETGLHRPQTPENNVSPNFDTNKFEPEQLSQLSPRSKVIYMRLKTAISVRKNH